MDDNPELAVWWHVKDVYSTRALFRNSFLVSSSFVLVHRPNAMASDLETLQIPTGLEVGLPTSQGTSNRGTPRAVPAPDYDAPENMQDGMSQWIGWTLAESLRSESALVWAAGGPHNIARGGRCFRWWPGWCAGFGAEQGVSSICRAHFIIGYSRVSPQSSFSSNTAPFTTSPTTTPTSSSATTTVPFVDYAPLRPSATSDTVALNCPVLDQKKYTTARGQTFLMSCNVGLVYYDLMGMLTYVVDDCIEACSSFNYFTASNSTNTSKAIYFTDKIYDNWYQHANCWLKTQEEVNGTNENGTLIAVLQGS